MLETNAREGSPMLKGLMMDRPLSIASIIDYAAEVHPGGEVVSATIEGGLHRYTYRDAHRRIAQAAQALLDMGIRPGDRVATLAMNGYRHFELYYAISGIGAVCHTINPRLAPDQLAYIVNHAGDRVLFFDTPFAPLIAKMRPHFPADLRYVALTDAAHAPAIEGAEVGVYDDLLSGRAEAITWPELDENTASALCYTSGTTGEPKGVLYSHRSTVLHALSVAIASARSLALGKRILPADRGVADHAGDQARRPEPVRSHGLGGRPQCLGRADGLARAPRRDAGAGAQARRPRDHDHRRLCRAESPDRRFRERVRH
jgi:acyl-CoA synthetase (AMP-forming)/AMP-acid ligase II